MTVDVTFDGVRTYRFLTDIKLKVGDVIESPDYTNKMTVKDIFIKDIKYINNIPIKKLNIATINNKPVMENSLRNKIDRFTEEIKEFISIKESEIVISITGNLCKKVDTDYFTITKSGLVKIQNDYITSLKAFETNVYLDDIHIGDLIKIGKEYLKVTEINGYVKGINFDGIELKIYPMYNSLLQKHIVTAVKNMYNILAPNEFSRLLNSIEQENLN